MPFFPWSAIFQTLGFSWCEPNSWSSGLCRVSCFRFRTCSGMKWMHFSLLVGWYLFFIFYCFSFLWQESHGRTISALNKTDENLSASLLNITTLENSLLAADEKYRFMQKLRNYVTNICDFLQVIIILASLFFQCSKFLTFITKHKVGLCCNLLFLGVLFFFPISLVLVPTFLYVLLMR